MKAVVGLLLMLLGVTNGVETYCNGTQGGAQCYGAVGGTALLQLMDSGLEIFKYHWKFNNTRILSEKENNSVIKDKYFFTPSNGTFRINNLSRNDSGEYSLETFNSNGTNLKSQKLQLFIQAPVSSVQLVSECLSQGEMNVSCFSEGGDSPRYNWTLDGHTLTDTELLSGNYDTNNIILKQNVSGRLVCSVWNHISHVCKEKTISTCGFIFINCTSDGKRISKWVFSANNTLCIESTTAPATDPTTEPSTVGKETGFTESNKLNTITSSSQTVPSTSSNLPWYIRHFVLMAGTLAALVILLVVGVAVIYTLRKKKNNIPKEGVNEQELIYADVRIMQRPGLQVKQREEVEVEYGQVKFSVQPQQTDRDDCVYAHIHKDR